MKTVFTLLKIVAGSYIVLCILLYFTQEKLIFLPSKLSPNYKFSFKQPFEELQFATADGINLNGVLFKSKDSTKGLIFYLHGNAGDLQSWGEIAKTYTDLNYDLFMLDYRGYGKSGGTISSEKQFFSDVQLVYDSLLKRYSENKIIVLGYSIGTGAATKIASVNNPALLILQAPYFSLTDIVHHNFKIIPTFLLKYKFETSIYLKACKMSVAIFHGNRDEVIYYESSLKLKQEFKPADTLITLDGQGHNNMSDNPVYTAELKKILSQL